MCKAPYIAYRASGALWYVSRGCCNSWQCPRCSITRAKQEYWRMVNGAAELSKMAPLYFLTITCKGRELSLDESEAGYMSWCNRLLTALRTDATRNGKLWHYALVTERQKRGHPHSHILTTYEPRDIYHGQKEDWIYRAYGLVNEPVDCLRSNWLEQRCVSAGLGNQYDISIVENDAAASRYIAKYLFKATALGTIWPPGWKRIRYSQSWPKNPDIRGDNEAMALLSQSDWSLLSHKAAVVAAKDDEAYTEAKWQIGAHVLIRPPVAKKDDMS